MYKFNLLNKKKYLGGNDFKSSKSLPEEYIPLPAQNDLLFLPMGGSGEIGMNVNLYGTNKHWIMLDLGISFGENIAGVDFVTANLELIKKSRLDKNLKGVVITHAHEDHIGAVHEIWPYFKFHVYLTKFSKEILLNKISNKPYYDEMKDFYIHEVSRNKPFHLGDFVLEFIDITHSIPEANAIWIKTPHGNILHTGDWKLDPSPVIGEPINEKLYRKLEKENVSFLVCDSTNVFSEGCSGSEEVIGKVFNQIFSDKKYQKGRLVAACFASNVARIKSMADAARRSGRKVCLLGRSIHKMTEAADRCQYPIHLDHFIDEDAASKLRSHEVMYICTGSQGDENSALARIARGVHRLKISAGDTVFFSSKSIPGNERRVNVMMNNLVRMGARVITSSDEDIHVSGHPCREELRTMYDWVKPKFIIPVHGENRHLIEHVNFAKSCGIDGLAPENGTLISMTRKKIIRRYNIGRWGLDGNRLIDLESFVLKEREAMGSQGSVFLSIVLNKNKILVKNQTAVSCSGLFENVTDEFVNQVKLSIDSLLNNYSHDDASDKKNENKKNKQIKFQSEVVRSQKVIERVRNIVKSALGKIPHIRVHWIYI